MQEHINFTSQDGTAIAGILHAPDNQPVLAYALFAHCFTCTKNINSAVHIAKALAEEGIATLRFDFAGLGASGGEFSDTNFSSNVQEIIDAAGFLEEQYVAPEILVGHSLGGTAVLAAASHLNSVRAIVSIGAPASAEHVLHHLHHKMHDIEAHGQADVELAGRTFTFKQSFVEDAKQYQMDIRNINKALMVMHSPIDTTVSVDEAAKIYQQAKHPKSFISLDNADHLLSQREDSMYAGKVLAAWARRYIGNGQPVILEIPRIANKTVVSADTDAGFLNIINADGHNLLADEPRSVGGTNYGPSPYDYLSVALGSCTAMTLNMYARHKKIPSSNIRVEVSHHKVHAEDCAECETKTGKVDVFSKLITISGDVTEQQKQRMLEIADRCPVHQSLHKEVKIESTLASSD